MEAEEIAVNACDQRIDSSEGAYFFSLLQKRLRA